MKSSSLFWKYFPFISFLHLPFNRLYHTGKCFNLLNTWKVCFRLVMCLRIFIQTLVQIQSCSSRWGILPLGLLLGEGSATEQRVVSTSGETRVSALVDFQPKFLIWGCLSQ